MTSKTLTDNKLWERPLGVPFADRLSVESAPDHVVRRIYSEHHSYRPELDRVTIQNHVGLLDGVSVGAVTYAMPRRSVPIIGVGQENIVEVARVCVSADIPNLASCLLSKSQERFMSGWGSRNGVKLLISMVHSDWDGSMFRALRGKGWENIRKARTGKSGNRDYTGIENDDKELWICRVGGEHHEQATL